MSEDSIGRARVSGVLRQREANLAHRGAVESPLDSKPGSGLRVCEPLGVAATVNQNSKWKSQLI